MEFRALGPLEVVADQGSLPLGGLKQRVVLARLLLDANRVVPADVLIEAVWGEDTPERARPTLQVYIANLRKVLSQGHGDSDSTEPRLVRQGAGYSMRVAEEELDVARFGRLVEQGRLAHRRGDLHGARTLLAEAVALWRGPAFPDLTAGVESPPAVAALEEQRLCALEERIQADLDAGLGSELVSELEPLTAAYPLRERFHAQRIVALYRAGRQGEALEAYRAVRTLLLEELGVDPGPELQRLEDAVLTQDPSLAPPASPTSAGPVLPADATPLIGRDRELSELRELLRGKGTRLVTLLGAGGTGKTRLALEVARASREDYADGVFYVALSSVDDHRLVLPTIASALRIREAGGRPLVELLGQHLASRRTLVVLDNFEQVLPAAAQVAELLTLAPDLTVLTTSRAALRVRAEHPFRVAPMRLPVIDPLPPVSELQENEAVRLFVDRARTVAPGFGLSEENAAAVVSICHRVDGLPLALELAASRSSVLSPQAILGRLDRRLRFLTGGPRDLPTRQQTLRGTIAWSHDLLDAQTQEVFRDLAVFSGGATLEAIEAVTAPSGGRRLELVDAIEELVAHSLLHPLPDAEADARFAMLETVREYAEELLDAHADARGVHRRHALHFLELAEVAAPGLHDDRQYESMTILEADQGNLRAALSWATSDDGDPELALRLAGSLWHFWEMAGTFAEGRRWLALALDRAGDGSPEHLIGVLAGAGSLAFGQGDYEDAAGFHERALVLARQVGDRSAEAFALNNLGAQRFELGDDAAAEIHIRSATEVACEAGDDRIAGIAVHNLGEMALVHGDYARAAQLFTESHQLLSQARDLWFMAANLRSLADCRLQRGEVEAARAALRESLGLAGRLRGDQWVPEGLERLAQIAYEAGQPLKAVRLLSAAAAIRRRTGAVVEAAEQPIYESFRETLRSRTDDEAFQRAWQEGQRLSMADALEYAGQP